MNQCQSMRPSQALTAPRMSMKCSGNSVSTPFPGEIENPTLKGNEMPVLNESRYLPEIVSELQEYFSYCDKDRDDAIEFPGFLVLLGYLGAHYSDKECHIRFLKMDTGLDGRSDIQEFVAGWMH
jgi:hypothetical protein